MENDTLVYGAGALAAYFILTKEKKSTVVTDITVESSPSAPLGPGMWTPPGGGVSGIGGTAVETITALSQPDFENWQRPQWAAYLLVTTDVTDLETASQDLWTKWDDPRNPFVEMFPSLNSFIFNLVTYVTASRVGEIITADSVPIYGTASNAWNSIHYWTCDEWRQWYDLNAQKNGTAQARAKFVDAWNHDDNQSILTWDAAGWSCGYDCDFVNYMRSKGLDVANFGTENTCTLISIPSNLIDAGAATSQGVKNTANTISFLLPATAVALTGIFIYSKYQSSK